MKTAAMGEKSIGVAWTKNALGEIYITLERLDDAQRYLEEAAEIRGCMSYPPPSIFALIIVFLEAFPSHSSSGLGGGASLTILMPGYVRCKNKLIWVYVCWAICSHQPFRHLCHI